MKNYVIINGVNSNTINGLGINELPPITKPQLRVLTEEIDGRDGDITTPLGYSAYDKTFTIGLFGTGYDIDEVISFFNDSGTIVFSNEPDKFYNYKTIAQIDYASLLKFKSASITIHCQPFKYPLEETPQEIDYDYIEEQDVENASLNNTGEAPMSISLKGNTSQYTTTGKNLANSQGLTEQTINDVKFTPVYDENGLLEYINVNGTASALTNYAFTNNITLNANDYVISGISTGLEVMFVSTGGSIVGTTYSNNGEFTINSSTTGKVWLRVYSGGSVNNVKVYPMVRLSTITDNTYEPYTNGASPNPDYPQPIHVVSGDNEVVVCGKNLFDGVFRQGGWAGPSNARVYATNGVRTLDTTQKYTISTNLDTSVYKWEVVISEEPLPNAQGFTAIYQSGWQTTNKIVATSTRKGYLYIDVAKLNGTDSLDKDVVKNFQYLVEYGEITTPTYEPYQSNSVVLTLGDKEICKIGNYEDKIFKAIKGNEIYDSLTTEEQATLDYGSWYLRKAISKIVLNGSETGWTAEGQRYRLENIFYARPMTTFDANTPLAYCDYFKWGNGEANAFIYGAFWYILSGRTLSFQKDENPNATTLATFKTWLVSHNLSVYYVLATPYLSLIEDTTLINQLDNIQNAMSYEGQTNVSQVNDDKPFLLDLKVLEQGSDEVVINNTGNIYSKPLIALEGTGIVNVYLNGNQIFQVDMTDNNKINIDIERLEAYNPDDNALMNRKVIGDISKFILNTGNNTIKIDGLLTKATISRYLRWL